MFCSLKRQNITRKAVGLILCLLIIGLTLFVEPQNAAAQTSAPSGAEQGLVSATWHRAVTWTVAAWSKATNWVKEQGSQIARAVAFWRDENQLDTLVEPSEPQVLGEEVDNNQSPITTPTPPPVILKPVPDRPRTITPRVKERAPTPVIKRQTPPAVVPPRVLELKKEVVTVPVEKIQIPPAAVEPVPPVAESTPDILLDPAPVSETETPAVAPAQPSARTYIPILARDTVAPTSQITAFLSSSTATPGNASSSPFTVAWSGTDTDITAPGAVASFDIQYQVDSGAWQDWLAQTVLLSDLFTGQDEKTYGFRSRSRDRYGNLESYPDSADASIYSNLSVPTNPTVDSPTSGTTYSSSASTYNVTLTGSGLSYNDLVTIAKSGATVATTTADLLGNWSTAIVLTEGTNSFTIQASETDGDVSSIVAYSLTLEVNPTHDVVINEIGWMGTQANEDHEWIELYNPGTSSVDLTGWTLAASDDTPSITLSGTIVAKNYFLLERSGSTTTNASEDQTYTGALENTGELLTLRNSSNSLVDKVGSTTLENYNWFDAGDNGTKKTMERKDPTASGTDDSNWATNDGIFITGQDNGGNNIKGTPKSLNSVNTTIPRPITDLQMQFIYTTTTSIRLYWTTPKTANLATTTPATYDIRYLAAASCPIIESNWSGATQATLEPTPSATEGAVATFTASGLASNTSYCFGIKTNNGSNDSGISNSYTASTISGSYTNYAGYPGTESTTLASSTSPYYFTGSIAIPNNKTLTIPPGTVVKLAAGLNIIFGSNSGLIIGTDSDAINAAVITSRDDDTYNGPAKNSGGTIVSDGASGAGDWGKILGGTGAVVTINHGIISYGGFSTPMMSFNAGTIIINNSIIQYSNNHGLIIGGASTSLTVSNSIIRNTLDVGLGITSSAIANIQGSTFTANRRGISVDTPAAEGSITILNNNFYSNNASTGDITKPNAGLHYADTDILAAQSNWWGSELGPITTNPVTAPRDAAYTTTGTIDYSGYRASVFTILPNNL